MHDNVLNIKRRLTSIITKRNEARPNEGRGSNLFMFNLAVAARPSKSANVHASPNYLETTAHFSDNDIQKDLCSLVGFFYAVRLPASVRPEAKK